MRRRRSLQYCVILLGDRTSLGCSEASHTRPLRRFGELRRHLTVEIAVTGIIRIWRTRRAVIEVERQVGRHVKAGSLIGGEDCSPDVFTRLDGPFEEWACALDDEAVVVQVQRDVVPLGAAHARGKRGRVRLNGGDTSAPIV